jgi:hypothetical protein
MGSLPISELIKFATLFAGRRDAYFLSTKKGGQAVWKPVTLQLFRRHLNGEIEIGTYPVLDTSLCRWGCIDVDNENEEEAWDAVTDLWSVFKFFHLPAWIERSRSKGYHCWLFADGWVPASLMRNVGLYINHIAGEPSKEVNPKNDSPWKLRTGLVNTVRTPYSGSANPGRMVFVNAYDKEDTYPMRYFLERAWGSTVTKGSLEGLGSKYKALRREQAYVSPWQDQRSTAYRGTSMQDAALILRGDRQVSSGERDNQYWTMANLLHKEGEPYPSALQRISKVWHEQTEQSGFPLDQALEKVHRLYRGR